MQHPTEVKSYGSGTATVLKTGGKHGVVYMFGADTGTGIQAFDRVAGVHALSFLL